MDKTQFLKSEQELSNYDISKDSSLVSDLLNVLEKYGILNNTYNTLDIAQGKLTLDQINLIFNHLPVDFSFADEDEISQFYSNTKHRIFPRSLEIIRRKVQDCYPLDSVDTLKKIIDAFKSGTKDKVEFWLEANEKFIYIVYIAVRDDAGSFKGILEMIQDATYIRSLKGNQVLLNWDKQDLVDNISSENEFEITKDTKIIDVFNKYPFIKDFLPTLNPKFEKLNNPIVFKTMTKIATIETISQRGNMEVSDLIEEIVKEINKNQ